MQKFQNLRKCINLNQSKQTFNKQILKRINRRSLRISIVSNLICLSSNQSLRIMCHKDKGMRPGIKVTLLTRNLMKFWISTRISQLQRLLILWKKRSYKKSRSERGNKKKKWWNVKAWLYIGEIRNLHVPWSNWAHLKVNNRRNDRNLRIMELKMKDWKNLFKARS